MGKGLTYLPPGQDFGDHQDHFPSSFGFSGSAKTSAPIGPMQPQTRNTGHKEAGYAHGGALHMHPHGHEVTSVKRHKDGSVVHMHAHGGMTVHHHDGRVTHHNSHGMSLGKKTMGDKDMVQDKTMVTKGVRQHEDGLHAGKHAPLHLKRGGAVPKMGAMPDEEPVKDRRYQPDSAPPNTRAAAEPRKMRTKKNDMPGDVVPYGVQPSDEPMDAGTEQGIPQLRRGGMVKGKR